MKSTRLRTAVRRLALTAAVITAVVGLTTTSAWALNTQSYNWLKSATVNQLCLDIDTNQASEGAPAQLWTCTRPVVNEQQFILVAADRHDGRGPVPGQWTIRSKGAGKCLWGGVVWGDQIRQGSCIEYAQAQSWDLRWTGEIVNIANGLCMDTTGDSKRAAVVQRSCNGTISQRWFF
jgi:hypothetical protein